MLFPSVQGGVGVVLVEVFDVLVEGWLLPVAVLEPLGLVELP
jgi:hypothetical protein